ncbi:MAG TPA: hypothetical protein VGD64_08885 [Acidisarcina sp.]
MNLANAANEPPAFDLSGPRVEVKVARAGKTLPISEVPNLAVGDRLWVHPDLPPGQSVHYLLVVVFLRGATNPPPDTWFTKFETWKKTETEGIYVTVPDGAQQALLLLAPETGGDFNALRKAVRGRPGAFVRASQDLNQASLDRGRLDTYLAAVREANATDQKDLQQRSTLLARSLNIRLDQQCFDKPTEQQAPCLVKNTDELVLDDSHSQSVVANWTTGNSADLLAQVSYTRPAGGGSYSVYVGAVLDMVRIFDNFHTAEYQYIPALGVVKKGALELKLNIPPSFHKPMSVLVIGLPSIETSQPPPLRAVDPNQQYCLQKDALVLPVEAGPLAFSTDYAHDVFLRVQDSAGEPIDVPARADAARGGYVLDQEHVVVEKAAKENAGKAVIDPAKFGSDLAGKLHGQWGFDSFDGPEFKLQVGHGGQWSLAAADQHSVIVGHAETLHFEAPAATCVADVDVKLRTPAGQVQKINSTWKVTGGNQVAVELPLANTSPGDLVVRFIEPAGTKTAETTIRAYAEAGRLERFTIYEGDQQGTLKGAGLAEVTGLDVRGIHFAPAASGESMKDSLPLVTNDAKSIAALHPDGEMTATVKLKDGRTLELPASVESARPRVSLVSKSLQPGPALSNIKITAENELPVDATLTFAVKAESPATLHRNEKIEVASEDNSFRVILSVADNTLVLQDKKTALVTLNPAKAFGGSAFGPLQFRPVDSNGVAGDWQPLVTLVRVPQLTDLKCPPQGPGGTQCTLSGADLFLLDSVATTADFANAVSVPEGFAASTLSVPRPGGTSGLASLYVKLRDDPAVTSAASLPLQQQR